MKHILTTAFALALTATAANAATYNPTFNYVGAVTTGAGQQSGVYQADLTGFPLLTEIATITITDDGLGTAGSPGAFSGFDLDALFIDVDGNYATTGDQHYASSFLFSPGTVRADPTSNLLYLSDTSGPLQGMNADGTVNETFATLNVIDALYFSTGSLTLGDGGSLSAIFDPKVAVVSTLFLIAAEVGDNGEGLGASITVSDVPAVPIPAAAWLFASALGVFGYLGKRKAKA